MTTTWLLIAAAALVGVAGYVFWPRIERLLSPTAPSEPDDEERPDSGADEEFGQELQSMRTMRELEAVAADLGLDLLDADQCQWAEDALELRLMVAEDIDHFSERVDWIVDQFQPGWYAERPTVALPSFGAVHALIEDTTEWKLVTA